MLAVVSSLQAGCRMIPPPLRCRVIPIRDGSYVGCAFGDVGLARIFRPAYFAPPASLVQNGFCNMSPPVRWDPLESERAIRRYTPWMPNGIANREDGTPAQASAGARVAKGGPVAGGLDVA